MKRELWTINLDMHRELANKYREMGRNDIAMSLGHQSSKHEGKTISLLTLDELQHIQKSKPNEILIDIFGDEHLAKDCDDETRFGYVAYGYIYENENK